jgi:hypothetical protein
VLTQVAVAAAQGLDHVGSRRRSKRRPQRRRRRPDAQIPSMSDALRPREENRKQLAETQKKDAAEA